jgi:hypothetical protein
MLESDSEEEEVKDDIKDRLALAEGLIRPEGCDQAVHPIQECWAYMRVMRASKGPEQQRANFERHKALMAEYREKKAVQLN